MSLRLQEAVSLKPFNTFGVDVNARLFAEACNDDEVREALAEAARRRLPLMPIGGGSNLLLTGDVEALVLRMASRGLRILEDDGERVLVEAEAGEPWHPFVLWSLEQGLSGLENLSLIPGTVGAAPMQNIGAYGVEIKDVFAGLTALDRRSGELREFGRGSPLRKITGRGTDDPGVIGDLAGDQVGVAHGTDADVELEAFANEVYWPVQQFQL